MTLLYRSFLLLALALGCRSPEPLVTPSPIATFYGPDSGALIRLRIGQNSPIVAHLVTPLDSGATSLLLCPVLRVDCRTRTFQPDTVPLSAVTRLEVRASAAGKGAYTGFFLGGLIGALIRPPDRAEDTGPMLLGLLAGAGLGALIGSRVDSWTPVIPCYPHECFRRPHP